MLKDNERIDKLIKERLQIIQSDDVFSFSTDALLLAHFTPISKYSKVMDLCSGNGIIPLLLSHRTTAQIDAIEIQPELSHMAKRSIMLNHLQNQIHIETMDLKEVTKTHQPSQYDIVTCNPPYFRMNQSYQHLKEAHRIARHEVMCTVDDCIKSAKHLLKEGGKYVMVIRADRLMDGLISMRNHRIEPKKIYNIYSNRSKPYAITIVVEGIKGGKPDCKVMAPFYIYNDDGTYSNDMMEVYYG